MLNPHGPSPSSRVWLGFAGTSKVEAAFCWLVCVAKVLTVNYVNSESCTLCDNLQGAWDDSSPIPIMWLFLYHLDSLPKSLWHFLMLSKFHWGSRRYKVRRSVCWSRFDPLEVSYPLVCSEGETIASVVLEISRLRRLFLPYSFRLAGRPLWEQGQVGCY